MTRTKQEVRVNRLTTVMALCGGTFLFSAARWGGLKMEQSHPHSIFFGDASHWPRFIMKGFSPLDFVMTCFWFWLIMYLAVQKGMAGSNNERPKRIRGWLWYGFGYFSVIGAAGGVLFTPTLGWYFGLEGYVMMGLAMTVFMAFIAALLGVTIVIGGIIMASWRKIWPRLHKATSAISAVIMRNWEKFWPRLREFRLFQPAIRLARYFNADDVPDTPTDSSASSSD